MQWLFNVEGQGSMIMTWNCCNLNSLLSIEDALSAQYLQGNSWNIESIPFWVTMHCIVMSSHNASIIAVSLKYSRVFQWNIPQMTQCIEITNNFCCQDLYYPLEDWLDPELIWYHLKLITKAITPKMTNYPGEKYSTWTTSRIHRQLPILTQSVQRLEQLHISRTNEGPNHGKHCWYDRCSIRALRALGNFFNEVVDVSIFVWNQQIL